MNLLGVTTLAMRRNTGAHRTGGSCICSAWQREGLGVCNYQVGGYKEQSVQSKNQWTWEAPITYRAEKITLQKLKWWNMTQRHCRISMLGDIQILDVAQKY